MKNNIFALTTEELKATANVLQEKIEEGLTKDEMEIKAYPTYIKPKKDIKNGTALVLDWGGTNFRAAIVKFNEGKASIIETKKTELGAKETAGFTQEDLHEKMAETIGKLTSLDGSVTHIGYCFSYPAQCTEKGDAILKEWTKGIDINDMVGKPKENPVEPLVGTTLKNYLNKKFNNQFKEIKVLNDTVACMFAGLTEQTADKKPFDSYIGLIVGTGTNMASLMRTDKIEKLKNNATVKEWKEIPVNLESGNFEPPYLTVVDGLVDAMSNNKGKQRFEKVISGGYLGEIFKVVFQNEKITGKFDGEHVANMVKDPTTYPAEQVNVAAWIDQRSAKLVAASLAGLVQVLRAQDPNMKKFCLLADGSVFWDKDLNGNPRYKRFVDKELKTLLPEDVSVTIIDEMEKPNLIGSAIAALS